MRKKPENEETRLFCQICVISGISIEGVRPPVPPPGYTPMILRQDRPFKIFQKKATFKAKLK